MAEAVVVDDGSTDGTAEIVRSHGAALISLPFNLGVGGAVQTGLRYALARGADVAVQLDADGQHPPREVSRLVEPVVAGESDVCVGSRFLEAGMFRQTRARSLGIAVLAAVVSRVVGRTVTDPTSGFRAFGRSAMEFLVHDYPYDFPDPETLVTLGRAELQVIEIPVSMEARRAGSSAIGPRVAVTYMLKVLLAVGVSLFRKKKSGR